MDKHAVALVLEEMATLLEVSGENRFKARAFRRAARAVDKLDVDLEQLLSTNELVDVPGIGPATARVVAELVTTGRSSYHTDLRGRAPSGMRELLRVPGLGVSKINVLFRELGVRDLDTLEDAARSGRIAEVRGFGARTQERILAGIPFARGVSGRRRFHQVEEVAERIAAVVGVVPGVARAELAGELRRRLETVSGIAVVAAVRGARGRVQDVLQRVPGITWTRVSTDELVGRLADGVMVEIRLVAVDAFGVALMLATGSDEHVARVRVVASANGVSITDQRLMRGDVALATPDEEAVYDAIGLAWVPPELRESGAEVDVAARGRLPVLVELDDLRGCFHCHTTYSDGRATVPAMAETARELGWRYLGIADHSRNAGYAGGLTPRELRAQRREIDKWNRTHGAELWLFAGLEADILPDGGLDFAAQGEPEVLDALDFAIGSVHSAFGLSTQVMTERVLHALDDPHLTMLGHATGRLLLTREGYTLDLDAVIDRAADVGAAIEINADPHRLDLSWQHWPRARQRGVRTSINPDAHSPGALGNVRYGVNMARKAWLTAADVVNSWPIEDVRAFLASRKAGR